MINGKTSAGGWPSSRYAILRSIIDAKSKMVNTFVLRIHDNGVGILTSVSGDGQGLTNMHKRAKLINGTLRIQRDENEGKVLELLVPH